MYLVYSISHTVLQDEKNLEPHIPALTVSYFMILSTCVNNVAHWKCSVDSLATKHLCGIHFTKTNRKNIILTFFYNS